MACHDLDLDQTNVNLAEQFSYTIKNFKFLDKAFLSYCANRHAQLPTLSPLVPWSYPPGSLSYCKEDAGFSTLDFRLKMMRFRLM